MRRALLLAVLAGCAAPVNVHLFDTCGPDDTSRWPIIAPAGIVTGDHFRPFDADLDDHAGPIYSTYGRAPEIVAVPNGFGIDVLVQDQGSSGAAHLLRIERSREHFALTSIVQVPSLGRIMGLTRDPAGARYVATGVVEGSEITLEHPAPGVFRPDIVRVLRVDRDGAIAQDIDLDLARGAANPQAELIINPMVAATSRLLWGGGRLALLHGINTDPDGEGVRHQKALTTHLDPLTGEVTRTASVWVSHSFDQRMIHDGTGFVEMHLGDAYPRQIVIARVEPDSGPYPALHVKGTTGDNNTFSRLGGLALIDPAVDPDFGYLALFAAESTPETSQPLSGPRNLGIVRLRRDFEATDGAAGEHLDPDLPDEFTAAVDGAPHTNRLRWLTAHEPGDDRHVDRPKLISVGCGAYLALWEEWEGDSQVFLGTYGMALEAAGAPVAGPVRLTDHHLPRGDDAFELDNAAAWISGDRETGALYVNRVSRDLRFTRDPVR
jgi:hypothetical protein